MATFEKTHARKKHYCVVEQLDNALSLHEWAAKEDRLVGYRNFPNSDAAKAALKQLVAERMAAGYTAADAAAKALASKFALQTPKKLELSLPIRVDLSVCNESNGLTIATKKLLGTEADDNSPKWTNAIDSGLLIPVALQQDDPFVIRVVAGEKLTAQEEEEWVGRVDSVLDLPDGELCIGGGAEHIYGNLDDVEVSSEYLHFVSLPPGRYHATLYMHLLGINGWACLDGLAGGYRKSEPAGAWFRRTRGGLEFPTWLVEQCIAQPDSHPGHESEWRKRPFNYENMPDYVGFLLHLTPAEPGAEPPRVKLTEGWYSESHGARKPELCPIGIEAPQPIKHKTDVPGKWIWPQRISEYIGSFKAETLEGGPLSLSLSDLQIFFTLAQFSSAHALPEIQLISADGASLGAGIKWPDSTVAISQEDKLKVMFECDSGTPTMQALLQQIEEPLSKLPNGTHIELTAASVLQHDVKEPLPGSQRYVGKIVDGRLEVSATFPKLDKSTLMQAMDLIREAFEGRAIQAKDETEAATILAYALKRYEYQFEDNQPVLRENRLMTKTPDKGLIRLLGVCAFHNRYRCTIPVDFYGDEDYDDDTEW